ncbi:MAG: glutamate-5-semialdehyde dehydrogenase, partial [Desulfobacterales bacterium]|nr:glutamate-5-semialdehyde dehydrogenase [Desulfobacterales bacterium]
MSPQPDIREMARAARNAAGPIGRCPTDRKNEALLRIAEKLQSQAAHIRQANQQDLEEAEKSGLSSAMLDRLTLRETTLRSMGDGLRAVVQLEDPVGTLERTWMRPNGLQVSQMRVPLGVIGIIYESRPNVTVDAAGLCLKAGNAVILRGGSEAFHSNQALAAVIRQSLQATGLPEDVVQVLPVRDRDAVHTLLQQDEFIDLIIPRGGEGLIRFVAENSRIPVL